MLLFDRIIANQDRHLGNLGYLRSNITGRLTDIAPIFDNGMALLHQAMDMDFPDSGDYLTGMRRFTFSDLTETDDTVINYFVDGRRRGMLRKLLTFEFQPHPQHNVSPLRLEYLSKFIQTRAKRILGNN